MEACSPLIRFVIDGCELSAPADALLACKGSALAKLVQEATTTACFGVTRDEQGRIVVRDRDARAFGWALHFACTGLAPFELRTVEELEAFQRELDFWLLVPSVGVDPEEVLAAKLKNFRAAVELASKQLLANTPPVELLPAKSDVLGALNVSAALDRKGSQWFDERVEHSDIDDRLNAAQGCALPIDDPDPTYYRSLDQPQDEELEPSVQLAQELAQALETSLLAQIDSAESSDHKKKAKRLPAQGLALRHDYTEFEPLSREHLRGSDAAIYDAIAARGVLDIELSHVAISCQYDDNGENDYGNVAWLDENCQRNEEINGSFCFGGHVVYVAAMMLVFPKPSAKATRQGDLEGSRKAGKSRVQANTATGDSGPEERQDDRASDGPVAKRTRLSAKRARLSDPGLH
eukprot:TRINITY_DN9976_c0_g1_i1.p1 TRINITY_DN9976_c0_g1~~TRINITY_DN9976_c0_g1_i1.p1  ORF type:complete len:416 (-),score=21.85 TRINITY_DN9976_c0_g1_i1:23-1240(-)